MTTRKDFKQLVRARAAQTGDVMSNKVVWLGKNGTMKEQGHLVWHFSGEGLADRLPVVVLQK